MYRKFPLDMAGFGIHISELLSKPEAKIGFVHVKQVEKAVKVGYMESVFLEYFTSRSTVECRGSDNEVITLL